MPQELEATQEAENIQEAQQAPEQSSPAVEDQAADQGVDTQPQSDKRGNRAQRRISDLSKQFKESQQEVERLKEAQAFFNQSSQAQDPWQAYESGDITIDQLKSVVNQTSTSAAEFAAQKEVEKLRREQAHERYMADLEADSRKLEAENPRFNPSSPEFDQEYVDEMAALYKDAYLGKPNAPKPSQFVARFEKLRAKAEAAGVERSSAQLADQAAQSAVVGSGGAPKGKVTAQDLIERGKQSGDFTDLFKGMANG